MRITALIKKKLGEGQKKKKNNNKEINAYHSADKRKVKGRGKKKLRIMKKMHLTAPIKKLRREAAIILILMLRVGS